MVNCSNCGLENDDSFDYCLRCGSSLKEKPKAVAAPTQQVKECPQCGARVPKMFRFCGTCGFPFNVDEEIEVTEEEENQPTQNSVAAPPNIPSTSRHETRAAGRPIAIRKSQELPPPIRKSSPMQQTSLQENNDSQRGTQDNPQSERTSRGERPPIPAPTQNQETTPSAAFLIVINKDGSEGEKIPLHESTTLGRSTNSEALSEDPCLSPKHVNFTRQGDSYAVSDINSLNGVFISVGQEKMKLEPGDQLRFGRQLIEFRLVPDESNAYVTSDGTWEAGSEDAPYWGLVAIIAHPKVDCQVYPIMKDVCIIGRENGDITMPNDFYVSGTHLEIARQNEGYSVRDLHSSNGTFIRIKQPVTLPSESKIMLGQQLFLLRY